jgi:hypothetical protein
VRRGVDDFAIGQHTGGIAEPHWIPVRLDLARGRPTGASSAVKSFKRRRIEK